MRNIRKTLISLALFLFFFSLISNVYAVTPISSCTVINSPGEYVLTNDIDASGNSVCINIQSNNVLLNCMGYKLIGRYSTSFDTTYGIYISRSSQTDTYITIRDCYLHDFAYFITFERSNYNIVDGVTCYGDGSSQTCVSLYNVFYSNFSNIYCDGRRGMSSCTNNRGGYNNFTNIYAIDTQVGDTSGNSIYNNYTVVFVNLAGSSSAFAFSYGVGNIRIYNSKVYNARYGIYSSNLYDSIILNSTFVANCAFYLEGGGNNYIYNNLINSSTFVCGSPGLNYWNTTLTPGTNIVGGSYIGGNYWGSPDGTGFSDTCSDTNNDGICDSSYTLATDNIDYLPLARYAVAPTFSVVFNYNSVDFGTVTPNTIAEAKSINYNVSITTNTNYKVSVNATNWSGPTTISADTIYFAVNDTLDKLSFSTAKQLSNSLQQIAVFPSTVTTNYHAFYFNVPVVPTGTYTATITITYEVA